MWPGKSDRWVAVDVHMDTVGVEQMTGDPFSGEVRDGRVWGRGAVDTKATLAVMLAILEDLWRDGRTPVPSLLVAATVDEEVTATGAPAFAAWVRRMDLPLDQLAVAEPTLCGPVIAHKGGLRVGFTIHGKAAHSSQPHLGENAIVEAARVVLALQEEHERLAHARQDERLGPGTLVVTLVDGGTGTNVVPSYCSLNTDRRLIPGETPEEAAAGIIAVARRHCLLPMDHEITLDIGPFSQDPESPWIRQLVEWSGRAPAAVPYCTNAWAYPGLAKEIVVIGPGSIDQAHGAEEWVEISELEKMAAIYSRWLLEPAAA
jgi:acetylornithine deacetylase/succinyl-diaminopimelate desuccinylase-like protein